MNKLEELIQRIDDKISDIQLRLEYLEERVETLEDENETISYWTGRYVSNLCDLVNQQEIKNKK